MGITRLWLALLVLASHTGMISVWYGPFAVECFYLISGFYIQMILHEKYARQPNGTLKFYASRFLRIYIPYWIILAAVFTGGLLVRHPQTIALLHPASKQEGVLSALLNIFIIGSEELKLLRILGDCTFYLWDKMLIAPAWSIAIELFFYAAAPFLLRRTLWLVIITLATAAAKFLLLGGYAEAIFRVGCGDSLFNGIVPLEMGVFTLGALAYRFYARHREALERRMQRLYWPATLSALLVTGLFGLAARAAPAWMITGWYCLLLIFAPLLPFLFAASRKRVWDRRIGELSYAVYLWHLPVVGAVGALHMNRIFRTLVAALASIALAIPVAFWIERPLTALRHRLFWRQNIATQAP